MRVPDSINRLQAPIEGFPGYVLTSVPPVGRKRLGGKFYARMVETTHPSLRTTCIIVVWYGLSPKGQHSTCDYM